MKKFLVILSLMLMFSCNRVKVEPDVPACIKDKITEYMKSRTIDGIRTEGYLSVYKYEYQGKIIYRFKSYEEEIFCFTGDCPNYSIECRNIFYNENCERIDISGCDCGDSVCENFSGKLIAKIWSVEE